MKCIRLYPAVTGNYWCSKLGPDRFFSIRPGSVYLWKYVVDFTYHLCFGRSEWIISDQLLRSYQIILKSEKVYVFSVHLQSGVPVGKIHPLPELFPNSSISFIR